MVVEVVSVNAEVLLELNGAHFLRLSQCNVGCSACGVGESGSDGVPAHSSHSRTDCEDESIGFEDVVSNRKR